MGLSDGGLELLESKHVAAMVTVAADGVAKAARVAVAVVDEQRLLHQLELSHSCGLV